MPGQGYPLQQYTNLDGDIVLEVLSDGTIILINGTIMASGMGSPEGVVTAPPGSWYVQTDGVSPNFWFQKQVGTGNTGWASIGGGVANIVTSVFGRFGDVVAVDGDYGSVPNLNIGDGVSSIAFDTVGGAITIDDAAGNEIALDGVDAISLNANATINLNATSVLVNGSPLGGVTSIFGRAGVVVAAFDDYAAVTGLLLGEGGFSKIQFLNGDTIELRGSGAKVTRITLDGLGGTVTIVDGATSSIQFDGAGNIAITSLGGVITLNGNIPVTDGGGITDLQITDGVSQGLLFESGTGSGAISLADGTGNNSISLDGIDTVQIASPHVILLSTTGSVQLNGLTTNVQNLQIFANNAAAITGGLIAGDLYRTGADPDVVCVVH